jgi:hypothetical protein
MMREVFEKGLASTVARWMLDGSAEALIERVAAAGVLKPEEVAALRQETRAHLEKVRDEGAPYAELVSTALREVAKTLPFGQLAGAGLAAASQLPLRDLAGTATRVALGVAARAAQAAAERAQTMADAIQPTAATAENSASVAEELP